MPWINTETDVLIKSPAERFYIGFDFEDSLSAGETIDVSKTEIKVYKVSTMEEVENDIIDRTEIYYKDDKIVIFPIYGGEPNTWYLLKVKIETSLGNVFEAQRRIRIEG